MTVETDVRAAREALVREHMESENRHDFDATIDTFAHPRYEIVPTGEVFDGEEEVRGYYEETRTAFPDQRNELIALHHADDARDRRVRPRGHPQRAARAACRRPGKAFSCRMAAFFLFEDDRIVERARLLRRRDDPRASSGCSAPPSDGAEPESELLQGHVGLALRVEPVAPCACRCRRAARRRCRPGARSCAAPAGPSSSGAATPGRSSRPKSVDDGADLVDPLGLVDRAGVRPRRQAPLLEQADRVLAQPAAVERASGARGSSRWPARSGPRRS